MVWIESLVLHFKPVIVDKTRGDLIHHGDDSIPQTANFIALNGIKNLIHITICRNKNKEPDSHNNM